MSCNVTEVKTKCYNCHNDININMTIDCSKYCYKCSNCIEIQHIDDYDNTIIKGHDIFCKEYIRCDYCVEDIYIDKNNFVEYIDDDDFIFNKDQHTLIKHNDIFYHYKCFCKSLGEEYMNRVCNICKLYCRNVDNIKNINNNQGSIDRISACKYCYIMSDIRKCYNNGCNGEQVVMKCVYYSQCKNYTQGCEKCIRERYGEEYCDECR